MATHPHDAVAGAAGRLGVGVSGRTARTGSEGAGGGVDHAGICAADDAEADDLQSVGSDDMNASIYSAGLAVQLPSSSTPPDDRAGAQAQLERAPGNTNAARCQTAARRGRGPNSDPVAWTEVGHAA